MTDNIKITRNGNKLTVEVDLSKGYGPSSSGKTIIVASTGGGKKLEGPGDISINMTLYKKASKG